MVFEYISRQITNDLVHIHHGIPGLIKRDIDGVLALMRPDVMKRANMQSRWELLATVYAAFN
jgi:hypothetical protein